MTTTYEILGGGGFGLVRLQHHHHPPLAEKLIPKMRDNNCMKEAVEKECRALEQLRHPNIVIYYGVYHESHNFVIKMELCKRGSLKKVLADEKMTYNVRTVLCWCEHLFSSLEYLKRQQIIHRDIKPANVFVTNEFHLKIGDFGCVSFQFHSVDPVTFVGTFRYMSPEMYDRRQVSHKSDLYSTGLVIWEIVTRKSVFGLWTDRSPLCGSAGLPKEEFSHSDFFRVAQDDQNTPIQEPECFDDLKAFIMQCVEYLPGNRPESEDALATIKGFQKTIHAFNFYVFDPDIDSNQQTLRKPLGIMGEYEAEGGFVLETQKIQREIPKGLTVPDGISFHSNGGDYLPIEPSTPSTNHPSVYDSCNNQSMSRSVEPKKLSNPQTENSANEVKNMATLRSIPHQNPSNQNIGNPVNNILSRKIHQPGCPHYRESHETASTDSQSELVATFSEEDDLDEDSTSEVLRQTLNQLERELEGRNQQHRLNPYNRSLHLPSNSNQSNPFQFQVPPITHSFHQSVAQPNYSQPPFAPNQLRSKTPIPSYPSSSLKHQPDPHSPPNNYYSNNEQRCLFPPKSRLSSPNLLHRNSSHQPRLDPSPEQNYWNQQGPSGSSQIPANFTYPGTPPRSPQTSMFTPSEQGFSHFRKQRGVLCPELSAVQKHGGSNHQNSSIDWVDKLAQGFQNLMDYFQNGDDQDHFLQYTNRVQNPQKSRCDRNRPPGMGHRSRLLTMLSIRVIEMKKIDNDYVFSLLRPPNFKKFGTDEEREFLEEISSCVGLEESTDLQEYHHYMIDKILFIEALHELFANVFCGLYQLVKCRNIVNMSWIQKMINRCKLLMCSRIAHRKSFKFRTVTDRCMRWLYILQHDIKDGREKFVIISGNFENMDEIFVDEAHMLHPGSIQTITLDHLMAILEKLSN